MRWPSNRASWLCLRFLCLCLSESADSQCFLFSLCFCGLIIKQSSLEWCELGKFDSLTAGLAESQPLLFCPLCSVSTPFWLVLWLSVCAFWLPKEFLLHWEILPSLSAGMFVEECLLSAPLSMSKCLFSSLLWFGVCDGLGLSGFFGTLTSEPVPVCETKTKPVRPILSDFWGRFWDYLTTVKQERKVI